MRLIIETSTDVIYVLNPEGKFTYISPRFEEVSGHPSEEILGHNFSDFLPPDQIKPLTTTFSNGMREKVSNIYECTMVFPNGDTIPLELNVNSICDANGKIIGRLGVARDIRGRRETERALRESELRYRLLAENSSDVIWTMDLGLNFTYVSPSNQIIFGYDPDEMLHKSLQDLLTPESYREAIDYFQREITAYSSGIDKDPFRKRTLELQQVSKDGRRIDIEVNISLINDGTGKAIGILGITRDVTARKRAENALKESEERLRLRNEVIEKDLKTAQLIQRSLISGKAIRSEHLDVDVRYLPLDAVGGDYFSFTELDSGGLGVFIGDVTSHGVTAALYLSLIKATTDRICRSHALDPADYITELNRELFNNMPLSFLTAIYGIFQYDPGGDAMRFTFSCAGHPPPLLYRAGTGTVDFIPARGPIIGMLSTINCEKITVTPRKGDRIYLYTDGLPETQNRKKELIELDRLPELIREATRPTLTDTLDAITGAINAFRGDVRFTDDIVLIGFEII